MDLYVEPIGLEAQGEICREVERFIALARIHCKASIPSIPVLFDLSGRAAGMYCIVGVKRWFRFNPFLFGKYYAENFRETVPHEVAHYVVDIVFGGGLRRKTIKAHGREWRAIMTLFGVAPKATHDHDLSGIPVRRQVRHEYFCRCQIHRVTTTKHNRIRRKRWQYVCVKCGETLRQRAACGDVPVREGSVVQLDFFSGVAEFT